MRRFVSLSAALYALAATFLLTACGGSGGATIPSAMHELTASSVQSPAVASIPTETIEAASAERSTESNGVATIGLKCNHGPPLHGPCSESVAIPAAGAYSGTLTLPSGTGTLAISTSISGLTYAPGIQATPRLEITLTAKSAVLLNGRPAFAISVPAALGGSVSLAQNNPWTKIAGPVTVTNAGVSFAAAQGAITIARGKSVIFALYGGTSPTPKPTPAPSPTPKPTPTPLVQKMSVSTTDYFTSAAVASTTTIDDKTIIQSGTGAFSAALGAGLHQVQITAPGYAIYNGAIQVPGGALSRSITLFPTSAALTGFVAAINADRATDGRTPVQLDNQLTIAAYNHAEDMAVLGYYAHFDPNGFAPTTRSLLLGSEMVGDEDIAAGFATWADAEYAFDEAEKAKLPHQSASDCVTYDDPEYAGHYCNIIWPSHNWVGLAAITNTSSMYSNYYDQEFGDLYGMVDTTVIAREPALNTVASLILGGLDPAASQSGDVSTMPDPVPISVTTLNADPTCASSCPAPDTWYPPNWGPYGGLTLSVLGALATSANQIYEPQVISGNAFSSTGASTIYWPGGTVMPNTYHDSTVIQTQSRSRVSTQSVGGKRLLVPNTPAMRRRSR